ncbi:protein cramped-like isoform X2 [Mizuhopecten yessoensis]|uniref:protein cramped-like isoform X2 n=1 Tax=Mizuhopecten yessoensis TaxID=6573 RepID=UPI000B45D90A|nr:protein cramped-like isoform X2 [Mizuhopecten yessoensis]
MHHLGTYRVKFYGISRMTIDPKDAVSEYKNTKGGNQCVEGSGNKPENTAGPSEGRNGKVPKRSGAVTRSNSTRSRIVKKPRRDLSPPESPAKKTVKEIKSSTPETKTKRQWELWSTEDKATFFEGLYEHGKDFDAIQNVIAQKCKKKGVAPQLIKNKDQVRHFYYRTWHKISKFVDIDKETKKETQELYGLINYGVLWKKHKAALNEKNGLKLDELIHTGSTTIKIKGKNFRIKTPTCNALKKINNIDDPKPEEEAGVQVPDRIYLDINPRTNAAWAYVQEMSQNPRLRMMLKPDKKLSSIIKFLSQKWKPHTIKLREDLDGVCPQDQDLTLFPHQECDVVPVSLKATKERRIPLAFNNYKENLLSSPSVTKGKKGDLAKNHTENSSELNALSVIFDSPRSSKGQAKDLPDQAAYSSFDVSAMVNDENAMFPDNMMSSAAANKVSETAAGSDAKENVCDTRDTSVGSAEDNAAEKVVEGGSNGEVNPVVIDSGDSEKSSDEKEYIIETKRMKEILEKGWNTNMADSLTVAELYLMFGKDGKLRLEYEWVTTPDDQLASKLTNMLRRLVHLATTEFTDFSKTSSNSSSPCQTCGASKAKGSGGRNAAGSKGQKPLGKYPLLSKIGGEGLVDVGTQTTTTLQNKQNENSSQGSKDAVFRVPVAGPSFLQKNTKTSVNQISLHQMELYTNTHKGRRVRPVNRKPMVVQRTLLPKTAPRQMLTFVPMPTSSTVTAVQSPTTIIGQPVGIPVSIQPSGVPPVNIPNTQISNRILQNATATGGRSSLSLPTGLSAAATILPGSPVSLQNNLVSAMGGVVSMASTPVFTTSTTTRESGSIASTTAAANIIHHSISPPSISSLLDISLSNIPTNNDNTEKLLDLAMENSNSGTNNFGDLLNGGNQRKYPSSALNTPRKSDNMNLSPPHSPSRSLWPSEDTGDMLLTLLAESPLKRTSDAVASANVSSLSNLISTNLFNENSRDSLMGRCDMDASFQCMLNENSIDYVAKFAELANHINQNENTQDAQQKVPSNSFNYDDMEGNLLKNSAEDSKLRINIIQHDGSRKMDTN